MLQVGNRIYHDQDGQIIHQTGERQGDVLPNKDNVVVSYIDLDFGQVDTSKYFIAGINTETKQPILEEIIVELTPEQQRIIDLENQLLINEGVI